MEAALDAMGSPTGSNADLVQMNDALIKQVSRISCVAPPDTVRVRVPVAVIICTTPHTTQQEYTVLRVVV